MTQILNAWLEGHYVGQFTRTGAETVFSYDTGASETPVSLSPPRRGRHARKAAGRFLENLLPDQEPTRKWMAHASGASSDSAFDLLAKIGGDVAGALVLLPEGAQSSDYQAEVNPASDEAIAYRIRELTMHPDEWFESSEPGRFSLAGSQAKFALTRLGDHWYWSNAAMPSTHILKPGNSAVPEIQAAEAATLALASAIGIPAPQAGILNVSGESAYVIERFDRDTTGEVPKRLHSEDLMQAQSSASDNKYAVTARQVVEMLRGATGSDEIGYGFIRQLASTPPSATRTPTRRTTHSCCARRLCSFRRCTTVFRPTCGLNTISTWRCGSLVPATRRQSPRTIGRNSPAPRSSTRTGSFNPSNTCTDRFRNVQTPPGSASVLPDRSPCVS